jgi:hypothetical protein
LSLIRVFWVEDCFKIVSVLTPGMVMAVDANSHDKGALIVQWPYVNAPGHHRKLDPLNL